MAIVDRLQIENLEHKVTDAPIFRSKDGYGRKIPTCHMVKLPNTNKWRRVYLCIFSNSGTQYIEDKNGDWIVIY